MKRVVLFSAFLTPFRSGAEACAEEVALRLSDQFEITIITARLRRDLPKNDLLQGKVPVIRVGLGMSFDKWLYPFLAPLAARKLKPEVLHAVLESFAGAALLVSRWIGPKAYRLLTLQTTNRSFLKTSILKSADRVTAISNVLVADALERGVSNVVRIPNGIDVAAIREACSHHQKVPGRMLFVGRLEKMKGVDVLLQAISMLSVPVDLHIVGDGSQRTALEEQARELGLEGKVRFLGYLRGEALLTEYAEAQVFCGLSKSEALGNVFLEAQAAGCAVVATKVGGIPDIVLEGATGLLVTPGDAPAAMKAIETFLKEDEVRTTLTAQAQENAARYDWDLIAKKYSALYEA